MPTVAPPRAAPSEPVVRSLGTYGGLCRPVLLDA
jgi:hypothetical protein